MSASAPTGQQIVDLAQKAGIADETFAVAKVMRYATDPLAALTWLSQVEQDDTLRFAYATAAELVRARGGAK